MNVDQAAKYLGIASRTLYKWKRQAAHNHGYLIFHGRAVRFRYRQTGAAGHGRISFEQQWLDELRHAMECEAPERPLQRRTRSFKHIVMPLGIPSN